MGGKVEEGSVWEIIESRGEYKGRYSKGGGIWEERVKEEEPGRGRFERLNYVLIG